MWWCTRHERPSAPSGRLVLFSRVGKNFLRRKKRGTGEGDGTGREMSPAVLFPARGPYFYDIVLYVCVLPLKKSRKTDWTKEYSGGSGERKLKNATAKKSFPFLNGIIFFWARFSPLPRGDDYIFFYYFRPYIYIYTLRSYIKTYSLISTRDRVAAAAVFNTP